MMRMANVKKGQLTRPPQKRPKLLPAHIPCPEVSPYARRLEHGCSRLPSGPHKRAYRAWAHMKERCHNPKHPKYHRYGGRGITVCRHWLRFENFLSDMGLPPPGLTLDRKDNDGNYEPLNCHWATYDQQFRTRGYRPRRTPPSPRLEAGVLEKAPKGRAKTGK